MTLPPLTKAWPCSRSSLSAGWGSWNMSCGGHGGEGGCKDWYREAQRSTQQGEGSRGRGGVVERVRGVESPECCRPHGTPSLCLVRHHTKAKLSRPIPLGRRRVPVANVWLCQYANTLSRTTVATHTGDPGSHRNLRLVETAPGPPHTPLRDRPSPRRRWTCRRLRPTRPGAAPRRPSRRRRRLGPLAAAARPWGPHPAAAGAEREGEGGLSIRKPCSTSRRRARWGLNLFARLQLVSTRDGQSGGQ